METQSINRYECEQRIGQVPVSVLIPAKNEQLNLPECLESVAWASEVWVVDSRSTDATVEIAAGAGAKVVMFEFEPGGPKKKNWALQELPFSNDWILILDADERIPPSLAAEIAKAVTETSDIAGYYLNRRLWFLGRWIRHAGYFPSWNLRLIRRGCGYYERLTDVETMSGDNEVHEHIILNGRAGHLQTPIDHYAYRTLDDFVEKHSRYSSWEASLGDRVSQKIDGGGDSAAGSKLNIRRAFKRVGRLFPFPHWLRFFYHYFICGGFLDGYPGYVLSHLLAEYEFWIWTKRRVLSANGSPPQAT